MLDQLQLLEALMQLEENPNIHTARLLILLREFCGEKGDKKIEGITKLVKLDFLLRYPIYLSKALIVRKADGKEVKLQGFEEHSVESKMIRFKYGPWDPRYRIFINILVGKDLCTVETKGDTIIIGITSKGVTLANQLRNFEEYQDIANRAILLRKHLNMRAMELKEFIYETFPQITTYQYGETIE
jgi:hypothetical protein